MVIADRRRPLNNNNNNNNNNILQLQLLYGFVKKSTFLEYPLCVISLHGSPKTYCLGMNLPFLPFGVKVGHKKEYVVAVHAFVNDDNAGQSHI